MTFSHIETQFNSLGSITQIIGFNNTIKIAKGYVVFLNLSHLFFYEFFLFRNQLFVLFSFFGFLRDTVTFIDNVLYLQVLVF